MNNVGKEKFTFVSKSKRLGSIKIVALVLIEVTLRKKIQF